MNKTLAIFIDEDYLIAATEPYLGKFVRISKRGNDKFPFYFFIDNINNKIDYSFRYKTDFENGSPNVIGNFLSLIVDKTAMYKWYDYENEVINLIHHILDDVKDTYLNIMNSLSSEQKVTATDTIPLKLAFSDNISKESREALEIFFQSQNFNLLRQPFSFPELLVNFYIEKNKLPYNNLRFVVIDALGYNLNMSVVSVFNEFDRERTVFKSFPEYGIDPRIQVIAKKIVDDVNRQENLLNNSADKKKEYIRHQQLASTLVNDVETKKSPYIQVETNFLVDSNKKLFTTLALDEIERLTSFHVRQIARFFEQQFLQENGFQTQQFQHFFFFGNTMNNELVKREFSRFGTQKITYFNTEQTELILLALLQEERKSMETTSSASTDGFSEVQNSLSAEYKTVPFVTVSVLKAGNQLKITTNDSAKGQEIQELKYLGNNQFEVIASTRSLAPKDLAVPINPVWVPGIQADFNITRAGKLLGTFKTRIIVTIELMD